MKQQQHDKRLRFSIRKLSMGACGVAIGAFMLGLQSSVQADEVIASPQPAGVSEAESSQDLLTRSSSSAQATNPVSDTIQGADFANTSAEFTIPTPTAEYADTSSDFSFAGATTQSQPELEAAQASGSAPVTTTETKVQPETPAKSESVDDYLLNLDYDKTKVLTRQGETLENRFEPATSKDENGSFVVIEKVKKNISTGTTDVSVNGNSDIYVGALLKADQTLLENQPTVISLPRGKAKVSLDLPGMTNGDSQIELVPTASNIQDGVNTLVDRWHQKYGSSNGIPARMQYDSTTAYSMNQIKAKLGADFEKIGAPLKIDFEAINKGEKQVEVVNFKQIYYTATFDAPEKPSDVFGKGVTVEDLKKRGIDGQTPPVYVSSVSYGRQMYVSFETTSKSTELKAAIGALIKGVNIAPGTEWSRVLKDTKVTAVILGGSADGAARVVTGDINTLKELIREGATFNAQNPGVAVSYKTAFLKDNAVATIKNNTDYIETKVTAYQNGYLNLHHKGAYIARYTVTWDEVSYDKNGKQIITPRQWKDNGKRRTAGFKTQIQFKGNVRNLRVKVEERTGLAWEPWRTVFEGDNMPLVQNRTITHWGTTLNPKVKEDVVNA